MDNLYYVTYQNFPDYTANSRQTISNIKYLIKENINVELVFPLRSNTSSSELGVLQEFYDFQFSLNVTGINHPYPFGKWKYFVKSIFHLSHLLWANKVINTSRLKMKDGDTIFTRSDWVFYFAAKKNIKVIFECHSLTRLRKLLLRRIIKKPSAKIIFLNSYLQKDSNIKKEDLDRTKVIHNGFDPELFSRHKKDVYDDVLVFTGNLERHGSLRNFDYIFNAFKDRRLQNKKLLVIGANDSQLKLFNKILEEIGLTEEILIIPFSSAKETIKSMQNAKYGLLINNSLDMHSKYYTSPLKYFEYLKAELKILAVNLPSHNVLPYSDKIFYFQENDTESFIQAFMSASMSPVEKLKDVDEFSLSLRSKKIKRFLYS